MIKFHLITEGGDVAPRTLWSRKKMLGIAIVGFVVIFSLIAIIVSQVVRQPAAQVEDDRSVELNLARLIKKEMNSSANPCSNFYLYSCGVVNYRNGKRTWWNVKKNYSREENIFGNVGGLFYFRRLKTILNEPIRANESKSVSQAKRIYQACMDKEDLAMKPVHQLIRNLGGWPVIGHSNTTANISLEENLASFFIDTFGSSPLYNIYVSPNSTFKISTSKPHYTSSETFSNSPDKSYKVEFRRIVANISSNGGQNITNSSINKIDTFVNEIRRYRDFRDNLYHNDTAFGESYTGTLGNLTSNHSGFDWVKFLQIYVKYYTGHKINSDTQIYIFSLPYINAINKYLLTVDSEFLQNLKVWITLIRIRESLPTFLTADLTLFAEDIMQNPRISDGYGFFGSLAGHCHTRVNPKILLRLYSERYLSEKSKEWVKEIYTLLKSEFKMNLENTEWLDTGAKSKLIKRLHEMKLVMGHPEHLMNDTWLDDQCYYEDLNVTRDGFLVSIMKFDHQLAKMQMETALTKAEYVRYFEYYGMRYDRTKNIVFVGMKFLQPPMIDEKQPIAYQFGYISFNMAHEIMHGFDFKSLLDTGSHHIHLANNTISGFKQRNRCIYNQFNNNTMFGYTGHNIENNDDNGKDENMCDTTGLQLAFSTYKKWKQQHEVNTAYPGLETFTSDELFFLGVTQQFCIRPESMTNQISHSFGWSHDISVHMMMQNTPGFGDVFQCQRGVSNLYPPENKVCRVYGKTQ